MLLQFCLVGRNAPAADFSGADLSGARLTNADLRGSNLSGADLAGANLSGTDLTGAIVTQQQLDLACGSDTKLPDGLKIKSCPIFAGAGVDKYSTGKRANIDSTLPKDPDGGSSSGNLMEVPSMEVATQNSSQPYERAEVSSTSGTAASSDAERQ